MRLNGESASSIGKIMYKRQSKNVQKWEFKNVQFYSFNTSFKR